MIRSEARNPQQGRGLLRTTTALTLQHHEATSGSRPAHMTLRLQYHTRNHPHSPPFTPPLSSIHARTNGKILVSVPGSCRSPCQKPSASGKMSRVLSVLVKLA